jgi:hypothetical protein
MVFAYRLLANPNYGILKKQSMSFFDDIDDGIYVGITSTFTEIEYIGIIKKVISYLKKRPLTPKEEQDALDDFQDLINGLGIHLRSADELSSEDNIKSTNVFRDRQNNKNDKPIFSKRRT